LLAISFGPYVCFPERYASILDPLILVVTAAPILIVLGLGFRFRNGYIKCPNCGAPFVDLRKPSMRIPSQCWYCHYSVLKPDERKDF
jgi:hypothetical protein